MGSQRIRHNVETEQQQLAGFIKCDDVGLCVCVIRKRGKENFKLLFFPFEV